MAGNTNYPGALDTTTNLPIASALVSTELDGDGDANKVHSNLHGVLSEAAVAIEAKIGTGASTPVANRVLRGSGTGTSAWAQVALATDVSGTLPLASLATGALDSGFSITSGFGTINNGSSSITTTGAVATGVLTPSSIAYTGNLYFTGTLATASNTNNYMVRFNEADSSITASANNSGTGASGYGFVVIDGEAIAAASSLTFAESSSLMITGPPTAGTNMTLTKAFALNVVAGDVSIAPTAKLYLDGGSDTYIYQESADDLHVVVGGAIMVALDQDTSAIGIGNGSNVVADSMVNVNGTFSHGSPGAFQVEPALTVTSAGTASKHFLVGGSGSSITTSMSNGAAARISTAEFFEPNITLGGSDSAVIATTIFVNSAPTEGDTNAAIYVAAGAVHIDSTPADTVVSGVTASFTAGEALEDGEVVYLKASDSKVWKAVATAAATSRAMGMVVKDAAADATVQVLLQGFLRADTNFPTWTVGGALYTPEAETSGKNVPEQAAPDSDGDFVQVLGWASDANTVYFNPSNDIIEHA